MSIKYLSVETNRLIKGCLKGDRASQRMLYEKYAPLMLGICRRYLHSLPEAEDALMRGFLKMFTKLTKLQDTAKFDFWFKRIIVNECLMTLRKLKRVKMTDLEEYAWPSEPPRIFGQLEESMILDMLDQLPPGYRTVFNMYVIEGFKHKEIAEVLGISVNTSKSQLIMARKRLQQMIEQMDRESNVS
jgi:RNA polymerase sigma-70 factor (ECF subfamily)